MVRAAANPITIASTFLNCPTVMILEYKSSCRCSWAQKSCSPSSSTRGSIVKSVTKVYFSIHLGLDLQKTFLYQSLKMLRNHGSSGANAAQLPLTLFSRAEHRTATSSTGGNAKFGHCKQTKVEAGSSCAPGPHCPLTPGLPRRPLSNPCPSGSSPPCSPQTSIGCARRTAVAQVSIVLSQLAMLRTFLWQPISCPRPVRPPTPGPRPGPINPRPNVPTPPPSPRR
jgi:hypothetical protein